MRILPASSSNSSPIHTFVWDFSVQSKFYFEMRMLLSLQPGAHFADLIFQKCSRSHPLSFIFYDFYVKLSPQKSPVHILPTLSSKSAPAASVFNDFYVQIELSLQSCALFVDNFPRSMPATLETAILFRRPRKPLSLKKHRVSHPRVFTREFTRFRISLLPTT